MKLFLFSFALLFLTLIITTTTYGCSNTPYKEYGPSPVYYAQNLSASELATHEANMMKLINYYLQGQAPNRSIFSSLIVNATTGEEICYGYNQGGTSMIYHGEIQAIQNCSLLTGKNSWKGAWIYTTGESCAMCQSAIMWSGFDKVIYGTSIKTLYCDRCMTQIAVDSNVINGYGYTALQQTNYPNAWSPVQIIGGILSNITDTEVFKSNYCTSATSFFRTTPYCNADFVGYNATCPTNNTCNNTTPTTSSSSSHSESSASFNSDALSIVLISFLALIILIA